MEMYSCVFLLYHLYILPRFLSQVFLLTEDKAKVMLQRLKYFLRERLKKRHNVNLKVTFMIVFVHTHTHLLFFAI